VYALTDAGRDELRDWLGELVAQPRHEYPAFVNAVADRGGQPAVLAPAIRSFFSQP
jgi:DNA-binding PadR family transcriptional regulator